MREDSLKLCRLRLLESIREESSARAQDKNRREGWSREEAVKILFNRSHGSAPP